jgi:hypothetical protein
MAAAVVAAQGTKPPISPDEPQKTAPQTAPQTKQQTADVVLTGCLIQGTGPAIFILDNAKVSAADPAERPQQYVLASGTEDLNFKTHLNHEVTVSGSAMAMKAPEPAGKKIEEKDLPMLTAKSLTMVSDRCLSAK